MRRPFEEAGIPRSEEIICEGFINWSCLKIASLIADEGCVLEHFVTITAAMPAQAKIQDERWFAQRRTPS
jgi:hypothetical protein